MSMSSSSPQTSENKSGLRHFLASVSTIKGDLSNITAPPFLLAPKSAVEFPATWCERPSILIAPALEPDAEKRALLVLKWYLSALKAQQYYSGDVADGVKKPLNAFLGELFMAEWNNGTGKTKLISEQVSHHPPVTACYLWNDKHGVRAQGYTRQQITFNGSVHIKQIGHAVLHLGTYDEDHVQTLPSVTIKSLLSGSPYPELDGPVHIYSSSGYTSKIEFSGTTMLGFGGDKKNTVRAKLYKTGDEEHPLYEVDGQWSDEFVFRDVRNNTQIETYNTHKAHASPLIVAPIDQQDPWESRRAWSGVIQAIHAGDMQATSAAKSKVEVAQRAMRAQEKAAGRPWEAKFFSRVDEDPAFEKLAVPHGEALSSHLTSGIWKFDEAKFRKARVPFRGGAVPGHS